MRQLRSSARYLNAARSGLLISLILWIAGVVTGSLINDWTDQAMREQRWLLLAMVLTIALLAFIVNGLGTRIERLFRKHRLEVTYLKGGSDEDARELYRVCREVVARAKPGGQILAVNSYVEVCSEDIARREDRQHYLSAVERHFGTLRYHRLMQVPRDSLRGSSGLDLGTDVSNDYRTHYLAMVDQRTRNGHGHATLLEAVPALYPTSFVVIENPGHEQGGHIIWQMNEHVPDGERPDQVRLTGVFIIDDPEGQFIADFKRWFTTLESDPLKRAITRAELLSPAHGK